MRGGGEATSRNPRPRQIVLVPLFTALCQAFCVALWLLLKFGHELNIHPDIWDFIFKGLLETQKQKFPKRGIPHWRTMGYKCPFKLHFSSLIMLRGTSEAHRNLNRCKICLDLVKGKKIFLSILRQRKILLQMNSNECVCVCVWFILFHSYYSTCFTELLW